MVLRPSDPSAFWRTLSAAPILVKAPFPPQFTYSVPALTSAADDSRSSAKERLILTLKRDMVYPQFAGFLRGQSGGTYSIAGFRCTNRQLLTPCAC